MSNLNDFRASGFVHKSELFTSSGTWTKSAKMAGDDVWVTAIGGGGSGANSISARSAGDGGEYAYRKAIDVSATSSETVTIGAGGANQTTTSTDGSSGGVTSLGSLLSVSGGFAGQVNINADDSGSYTGGARGGHDNEPSGQDNPCPLGGVGGRSNANTAGGGGGLVLDESGTTGGRGATTSLGYGGTGYGGGGGVGRNTAEGSGAGADGAMLIEWMETL